MDRKEKALEFHSKGYNCAQSVALTFCDEFGADNETTFRLAEALGFGLGCMHACGALTGMGLVVGMKMSDGNLEAPKTKKQCFKMMSQLTEKFEEKVGSTICREIKGVETGNVLRSCNGCITDAVELIEEYLIEK